MLRSPTTSLHVACPHASHACRRRPHRDREGRTEHLQYTEREVSGRDCGFSEARETRDCVHGQQRTKHQWWVLIFVLGILFGVLVTC